VWQAQLVQRQLSAAVLPYLSVSGTFSPSEVKFGLENYGPGPAIIKDAVLVDRGKPQPNLQSWLRPALSKLPRSVALSVATTDIVPGDAVRPGETLMLADMKAAGIYDVIVPLVGASDLMVCYCSILDQCWTISHANNVPQPVRSCNDHDSQMLGPVGFNVDWRHYAKSR
jgi:hypothetical protein